MKNFIKSLLSDESGATSSKRIVGILAALVLFVVLILNTYTDATKDIDDTLITSIMTLCIASLGLTSVDKWSKNFKNNNTQDKK